MNHIHPNSVWLSSTNEKVDQLNDDLYYHRVKDTTVFKYRCVATYVPNLGNAFPTPDEIQSLHDLPTSVRERRNSFRSYIDLAVGCRVRCMKNLGTQIGVFNGAIGTVVGFCFEKEREQVSIPLVKDLRNHSNREIPVILVQMDQVLLCGTDILPFAAEIDEDHPLKTNGKIFYRKQLPLELSHASTVHKYQGLTAQHDVVVDPCRNPFAMGLEYVALSRTRSLQKLHLISPVHEKHFASKKFSKCLQMIHDEYKRLSLLAPLVTDND
jgi:ATP-dependent exoDNAse (exonuclease V) alpha subunit